MLRYEMRFAERACKEFWVQVNSLSEIGPNLFKPILLHETSFAHFVGSVSVVGCYPRLGCASPGAITLSASFAG